MITNIINIQYLEHESSNAYKFYPFAESSTLVDENKAEFATDIFVDAILYPIIHSDHITGSIKLSHVDFPNKKVVVNYENSDELIGYEEQGVVELFDKHNRHAGTLICGPGWSREVSTGRIRDFSNLVFSSFVSCPIPHAGVYGISNEEETITTTRKNIILKGDDCIKPVLRQDNGSSYLSFDVQYNKSLNPSKNPIRQIIFTSVGKSLFSLTSDSFSNNTVLLTAPTIDREDVCWQAHKYDVATVVDTCASEDSTESCTPAPIPYISQAIEVCASITGNINIITEDLLNYKNPISITTVTGDIQPITPKFDKSMSQDDILEAGKKLLSRPIQSGNGIKISLAGLSNGK